MQDVMSLVDEAHAWVKDRFRFVEPQEGISYNYKWVIRSAMQKAIRRGNTEVALQHAFDLFKIDPDYIWYSILTVSTEDVGFGSEQGMLFSFAAQLKTFRKQIGEYKLLSALVVELCGAAKTRSQCELSWVVDTAFADTIKDFGKLSTNRLLEKVALPDAAECYAALAVLRGVVSKEIKTRDRDKHGCEEAKEIMAEQLPAKMARVAQMSIDRPLDNMSIATFPCFRIASLADDIEFVPDNLPPSLTINGYASEAYDMHEMAGKKAMGALYKQLKNKHPRFAAIKTRSGSQLIGNAVFCVEGAQVDRRILSTDLRDLQRLQDELSMTVCGVPLHEVDYVLGLVRDKIPRLNGIRKWAVGL